MLIDGEAISIWPTLNVRLDITFFQRCTLLLNKVLLQSHHVCVCANVAVSTFAGFDKFYGIAESKDSAVSEAQLALTAQLAAALAETEQSR